jgi:hypothetical protein
MQARFTPQFSCTNKGCSIYPKRYDRRAAGRRKANYKRTIGCPSKMTFPTLLNWVKEKNGFTGDRINRHNPRTLIAITRSASKPKIIFLRLSTQRLGDNVVYFQR